MVPNLIVFFIFLIPLILSNFFLSSDLVIHEDILNIAHPLDKNNNNVFK